MEHARTIVARGTSADRQVAHYAKLLSQGLSPPDALKGVVDHLIAETAGETAAASPARKKRSRR